MDFLINPLALLPLFVLLLYSVYGHVTRKPTAFDTLPWVGLPAGPLAKLRARFSIMDYRSVFASSWKQVFGRPTRESLSLELIRGSTRATAKHSSFPPSSVNR